jgi:carbamoylphosphate synthase large subunit
LHLVCSIESVDPMGIHTGDSITVAPALTLTDKEYQGLPNASIACLREIGVDTGGSNVQFAIHPETGRMVIIEMNPRVSRSSALASKATGFPIAKIAAKLAVGYRLDELKNDITQVTPTSFEAAIDYVVTKLLGRNGERFEYLTGNTAVRRDFQREIRQSQGLPFNPVNFHRYRLGQLRHADAFLYVRTALSESGASKSATMSLPNRVR